MITGNKGEWSELYVFLHLLAEGEIHAADDRLRRLASYFPIMEIMRKEALDHDATYVIKDQPNKVVEIYLNDIKVSAMQRSIIQSYAEALYEGIKNGSDRAFEIPSMQAAMSDLKCTKIKASSANKTDISMKVHDVNTGSDQIMGFSIKSELGNPPTLLNAGKTTNFAFEVVGVSAAEMNAINEIDTSTKILDRINGIRKIGSMHYSHMKNETFKENLRYIDLQMDRILAEALFIHYTENLNTVAEVVDELEKRDPLGLKGAGLYEYKFKSFLCSVALGMMPGKSWDGKDEANGGYIVVREDGEVLAYHIYNRDAFKDYLLSNTKFERASTKRHEYASLYEEGGKMYINLNLQIRFIK